VYLRDIIFFPTLITNHRFLIENIMEVIFAKKKIHHLLKSFTVFKEILICLFTPL